jgi:hypothetical protein
MGPFAEFREWLRTASAGSRVLAAIGAGLAVAAAAWLMVPSDDPADSAAVEVSAPPASGATATPEPAGGEDASATSPAGGSVAGQPAASSDAPAGPATATPGAAPAASSASSGGCVSPPGSAPGISSSEIRIAIGNTEVVGPAANDLFGIPPASVLRAEYEAVIDAINRGGGIACRKVVAQFYKINPADQASMQGQCRDIVDSGVYAVLDDGGWASRSPGTVTCFAQGKVLYLGAYFLTNALVQQLYPYVFSFYNYEELYRNTAFGLRDRGFFQPSNGFVKLGLLFRNCDMDAVESYARSLNDAGIASGSIVRYSLGCPSGFASPADIQQAVLTFRREGVTHLTGASFIGDLASFTRIAEQQGFRPKYGLPDETLIPISYGNMRADPRNIANAIAISVSRNGEERTPGMTPSAGTARCNEIMKSHKLKSTYEEPTGAGNACSLLWILQAGVQAAASLDRAAFAQSLNKIKSVELSYPQGPNDLSRPRTMTGGQFWRPAQYFLDCECWRVVDPNFKPSYR